MNPVLLGCNQRLSEWINDLLYIHLLIDIEINTHMCVGICERIYVLSLSLPICYYCSVTLWPHWMQHTRPPCPSQSPGACSNSCPSSRWCHPAISSSVIPFSFCLQSCPASGSFLVSQFFASGGQSIGVSAATSVLQWICSTDFL